MLEWLGASQFRVGKHEESLAAYTSALTIRRQSGSPRQQAILEHNMAAVHLASAHDGKALDALVRAAVLWQSCSDDSGHASSLIGIGAVHLRLGAHDSARHYCGLGLALARDSRMPGVAASALLELGDVMRAVGQLDSALVYYQQSLRICREDPAFVAIRTAVLSSVIALHDIRGRSRKAGRARRELDALRVDFGRRDPSAK
jgi:tetratricopeptide (TPR) repeat protein